MQGREYYAVQDNEPNADVGRVYGYGNQSINQSISTNGGMDAGCWSREHSRHQIWLITNRHSGFVRWGWWSLVRGDRWVTDRQIERSKQRASKRDRARQHSDNFLVVSNGRRYLIPRHMATRGAGTAAREGPLGHLGFTCSQRTTAGRQNVQTFTPAPSRSTLGT